MKWSKLLKYLDLIEIKPMKRYFSRLTVRSIVSPDINRMYIVDYNENIPERRKNWVAVELN